VALLSQQVHTLAKTVQALVCAVKTIGVMVYWLQRVNEGGNPCKVYENASMWGRFDFFGADSSAKKEPRPDVGRCDVPR
jgi:hypothetical protein